LLDGIYPEYLKGFSKIVKQIMALSFPFVDFFFERVGEKRRLPGLLAYTDENPS
jgi:hypothetical protein